MRLRGHAIASVDRPAYGQAVALETTVEIITKQGGPSSGRNISPAFVGERLRITGEFHRSGNSLAVTIGRR